MDLCPSLIRFTARSNSFTDFIPSRNSIVRRIDSFTEVNHSRYALKPVLPMDKQPVFFCVCSQKGGVGKSTSTILLASWLHYALGRDVLGGRYEYRRPQTTVISLLIMRGYILRTRCRPFRRNPLPAYHPLLWHISVSF